MGLRSALQSGVTFPGINLGWEKDPEGIWGRSQIWGWIPSPGLFFLRVPNFVAFSRAETGNFWGPGNPQLWCCSWDLQILLLVFVDSSPEILGIPLLEYGNSSPGFWGSLSWILGILFLRFLWVLVLFFFFGGFIS